MRAQPFSMPTMRSWQAPGGLAPAHQALDAIRFDTWLAQQQLDVALDAQRALIEIQRLTGQALVTPPAATSIGETP